MSTGFHHHGADGSCHDGPGGMFGCALCDSDQDDQDDQDDQEKPR